MEIEDREMNQNQFAIEELNNLMDTFKMHGSAENYSTTIDVNGTTIYPYKDDLLLAIYSPKDVKKEKNSSLDMFIRLLHEEPLENVPLYINTLPVLAKWRLEIGK